MGRSHNFSAGPKALPMEVLTLAHEEFFNFAGTGISVMEFSLRSEVFMEVAYQAEHDLRDINAMCCSCKEAPRCSLPKCR